MVDRGERAERAPAKLFEGPYLDVRRSLETPLGRITITGSQRQHLRVPARGFRILGAYALVLVLHGEGLYEDTAGTQRDVVAGDVILLFPSLPHTYGPHAGSEWIERYIVFEGPIFSQWEEAGLLDPRRPVVRLGSVNRWNDRIDHVLGGTKRLGMIPALEEVCRLQEFLAQVVLSRTTPGMSTQEDGQWLASACALLDYGEADSAAVPSLHLVAADLGLSYDGFRKRFRQLTGMAPSRYRETRRIDRACEMLRLGTMTNRAIAETLGFCDEFHFSRRFKQVTGHSPRAFRTTLSRRPPGDVE